MDYGLKVSQSGYDIASATDKQLVFSSEFNTLKVSSIGSGTANPDDVGSTVTVEISHGLGYVPAYTVFTEIYNVPGNDNDFYLAPFTYAIGGDASIIAYATSTKLYIRFGADLDGPSANNAVEYKYVIYLNKGSD